MPEQQPGTQANNAQQQQNDSDRQSEQRQQGIPHNPGQQQTDQQEE